ncbi:glycoside hydrolase family 2 protein [Pelagicoccus mobilis]|uniref:beta-galactosidase n=1 Tax=Pelagicoccus mobilis TaxID=415221 RepID=A0A934S4V1_9BACT|nr:glycoside hydrolase family 2 TIM barrel-domain containing protein [Pelagicoccus mobilis]MBK1879807.1 hypothetical protein [Pelagicoccus mobilis]
MNLLSAAPAGERIYLSGKSHVDAVDWDFYCSAGRKSGEWTKIPVPSNWEQQGFGGYNYGHDDPDTKHAEEGTYKTSFFVPKEWKDKHVRLVFEGAMTETSIKINGKPVGAPNQGGYNPFRFILDKHSVEYGKENSLEVLVKKKPSNNSLDWAERKADYWVFGGIYRPVYLEVLPAAFVNRVAIDAKADGSFNMDVFPEAHTLRSFREELVWPMDSVKARIETLDGEVIGELDSQAIVGGSPRVRMNTKVKQPALWSPEYPNLYNVRVSLLKNGEVVSELVERFGFRTFERRLEDGLYLNGKKIKIRGINRNMFDPKHGRVISAEKAWKDARAIKSMNVNLVRSHLAPTTEFMKACDELGLMVITELCNWHDPVMATPIARNIAFELVTKYQNHPSVVLWANGNENGFNFEMDQLYRFYDLQERPVIHPWGFFDGIDTFHYPKYVELMRRLENPHVYLPTEFLHGLYDGGHGAGLEDYWNAIMAAPQAAGGVLWCWADAALERTDLNGKMDTYGNRSADGLVGPNGEKEASFFTVREIWSPVQIPLEALTKDFNGVLPIENGFYETNLKECQVTWSLLNFSAPFSTGAKTTVAAQGKLKGPAISPGKSGKLKLPLPSDWESSDALEVVVHSKSGTEIMKWSWALPKFETPKKKISGKLVQKKGDPFHVSLGNTSWSFSPETGQLLEASIDGKDAGIGRGPILYAESEDGIVEDSGSWVARVKKNGDQIVITSENKDAVASFYWTISADGSLRLDYDYGEIEETLVYCAVGFDLKDEAVAAKRWLGKGPHRVWANRMKGPQHGLWESEYNDFLSGEDWGKLEFKGVFGEVDWMRIDLKSGASLLVDPKSESEIGVLNPRNAEGQRDKNGKYGPVRAWWHYPQEGGLYLFHKTPAIGSKFANANQLGPQSEPARVSGPISGQVTFEIK